MVFFLAVSESPTTAWQRLLHRFDAIRKRKRSRHQGIEMNLEGIAKAIAITLPLHHTKSWHMLPRQLRSLPMRLVNPLSPSAAKCSRRRATCPLSVI